MQTFTANEAKTHFGEFIDTAQRRPVGVTRRGRLVGIMIPPDDYEQMRLFYADRLRQTVKQAGEYAQQQGLTDEILEELLADES